MPMCVRVTVFVFILCAMVHINFVASETNHKCWFIAICGRHENICISNGVNRIWHCTIGPQFRFSCLLSHLPKTDNKNNSNKKTNNLRQIGKAICSVLYQSILVGIHFVFVCIFHSAFWHSRKKNLFAKHLKQQSSIHFNCRICNL